MQTIAVIALGDFKGVSRPEMRRNDDVSLSANFLTPATVAVQVDHPFKTHLFVADAVNPDIEGDGSKNSDQALGTNYAFGWEHGRK